MSIIYYIFAFFFGAVVGSFLNVLIYRMPKDISIIRPGSSCPNCSKPIKWYENIPIISFIILKGRCSGCQKPISIHYPIIETITGFLFVFLFSKYNLHYEFFFYVAYFCALIVISGIDFSYQIIPDIIPIPGIFVGLLFQLIKGSLVAGLMGIIFGGGMILLIRVVGGWVYKKEVMGLGDVYLTAMIGAFVGFPLLIPAIFLGALFGAILGLVYITATHQNRESPIPFGPFLAIGGILVIIFQPQVAQIFSVLGIRL